MEGNMRDTGHGASLRKDCWCSSFVGRHIFGVLATGYISLRIAWAPQRNLERESGTAISDVLLWAGAIR